MYRYRIRFRTSWSCFSYNNETSKIKYEISSLRKNIQALQKRISGTFFIFFIGLIFSFACIRLVKFVINNPQLFPEGSNEGYGTILLIFFALFTLRTTGTTYRRIIKSKRMELHLAQPLSPRQIMLGMFYSVLAPNLFISGLLLSVFFVGNIIYFKIFQKITILINLILFFF